MDLHFPITLYRRREHSVMSKHLPDAAKRLASALLVLDERKADVTVAEFTKANAGADGHFGVEQQLAGEFKRAKVLVGLGNPGPDEHRRLGELDIPPGLVQTLHKHIAAAAIICDDLSDAVLWAFEGEDRGDLDRGKRAVVEIALQAAQRSD